jgi:protein-tyrosine-phosphatase
MAAGYLQALAGDRVTVLSAGTEPKDEINPSAIAAMAEEGIDIANNAPKVLTTEAVKDSDYVITMGCGDNCPFFPGKTYLDWPDRGSTGCDPFETKSAQRSRLSLPRSTSSADSTTEQSELKRRP